MKKFMNAAVICAVALTACTTPFKKAKDGSEYKVISSGKGLKAVSGNFMELNSLAKYKDSVLFNSLEEGMPQYGTYDTASFPVPYKEAFANIRVGDSIVLRMSTDSLIKKGQSAPFMKKGQYIYQSYKVVGIYTTREQADSAQKSHVQEATAKAAIKQQKNIEKMLAENKAQVDADCKKIDEYLAKNNIKATKTKWGTYVAVQTEGTGSALGAKDIVSVNYTGKTFDSSRVFDSNTDPKFNHVTPYEVPLNMLAEVIPGWTDALLQMKKGTKATVYIPSSLGYGKSGRSPEIKPDAILVFDMEVVGVTTQEEAIAKREAEEKKMKEMQQKMMDSMQKANPQPNAGVEKK
jgi:FKBP-type peptidyl-prolyl cis-trans isomerase FkpA